MRSISEIFHYHVHVYYDAASRERAIALRTQIGERFKVEIGRLFDQAVGPHPCAQYEIGVFGDELARLMPWLMLNHQGLSIMLHPNTDLEREDHRGSAMWLGTPLPLFLDKLDESLMAAGHAAPRPVIINSQAHMIPT